MKFVTRSNPGSGVGYEIPDFIARLFEDVFGCRTALSAKHGLRWECDHIPVCFLHKITRSDCWVYILPTGRPAWKTDTWLNSVIAGSGAVAIKGKGIYRNGSTDHLEIPNVSWTDLALLAPHLISAMTRIER